MIKNRVKNHVSLNSELNKQPSPQSSPPDNTLHIGEELTKKIETSRHSSKPNLMKYPLLILRIFGLYHKKGDPYAIAIAILNWFNLFRFMSAYYFWWGGSESFSAPLVLKIIANLWLFACSFNTTIIYLNQEIKSRQPTLLENFYSLMELKGEHFRVKRLKKVIYIIFAMCLSVSIFNTMAIFISMFGPKFLFAAFKVFLAPFQDSDWAAESVPYKLAISFMMAIMSFHWTLAYALYLAHAMIVIEFFNVFNLKFSRFTKMSILVSKESSILDKSIPTDQNENIFIDTKEKTCVCELKLEEFRITHLKLSFVVHLLDRCYKQFIAVTLVFYIMIILLVLYIISDWSGSCISGLLVVLYPFWMIISLLILMLTVIFASRIHFLVRV
jgi:hypothetical protein